MAKNKQFRRTFNVNLIKKNLSHSTQDIAELFDVHPRTVQSWYKEGLSRIDDKKPSLVFGDDLYIFIKSRQNKRKTKCKFHEFYCCKCKTSVTIKDNYIEVDVLTSKRLLGKGLCSVCHTKVNKLFSAKKYSKISEIFIVNAVHKKHLLGSLMPNTITDIKREEK